ncbi:hypothetical protein [Arsenophonus apicola]
MTTTYYQELLGQREKN